MQAVLITGGAGAIGSMLAPLFARETGAAVYLLLRAGSQQRLQQRLEQLHRFWQSLPGEPIDSGQMVAVRGDVSAPRLGIDAAEYDELLPRLTHIVHAAGNVKLNQTLDQARQTAVNSVREAIVLAQACRERGQFQKLEYVSTVGVAGRTRGRIEERPYTEVNDFHNTYEAAKAEAERVLLDAIDTGLPATIHRPSMVVGDSQTGRIIHFQVFYYLAEFFAGLKTKGVAPRPGEVKLDIIPVDYVARAILLSALHEETRGRILHLCSGPELALPIDRLTCEARRIFASLGADLPRLCRLPPRLLRRLYPLSSFFVRGSRRRALRGLPYFLDYFEEAQLFENRRTQEFLRPLGLHAPPPDDYLERLLTHYWNEKYRENARPLEAAKT